jgi:hypothetical protein
MEFKRLFTRSEAESTLPLVRKIRQLDEGDEMLAHLQEELAENLRELADMGCYFKDWNFSVGLVDFPAVIDGETVFLCWRSDENGLAWYHRIQDGYQGRRPLPET